MDGGEDVGWREGVGMHFLHFLHFLQQALAGVVPTAITAWPPRWETGRVLQGEQQNSGEIKDFFFFSIKGFQEKFRVFQGE